MSAPVYSLLDQTEDERKAFFGDCKKGTALWRYSQEHLVVIKDEKACPFVKLEIILPLFCCLLDSLRNKHCRAWSSMINLWIDSRTCQKYRILLSARQRSNNYLEKITKRKCLGGIWYFTWKIWFHKILKLIFQRQSSCPRNICMYWTVKKTTSFVAFLEIFLYLKNCDSGKHVYKVLLIVLFIYFQRKIKFYHCIWSI